MNTEPFSYLPHELIDDIALQNLKVEDIIHLCETNQTYNQLLCQNQSFWRRLYLRDFKRLPSDVTDYKQAYMDLYIARKYLTRRPNNLAKLKAADPDLFRKVPKRSYEEPYQPLVFSEADISSPIFTKLIPYIRHTPLRIGNNYYVAPTWFEDSHGRIWPTNPTMNYVRYNAYNPIPRVSPKLS